MTQTLTHTTALDAFTDKQCEARTLLAQLAAQLDAMHDETHPDQIHWGHVGDVQRVVDTLRTLVTIE